jgi:DNA-binding transcriptional regulator YiaG
VSTIILAAQLEILLESSFSHTLGAPHSSSGELTEIAMQPPNCRNEARECTKAARQISLGINALMLRTRADLSPDPLYRLVGIGLSTFWTQNRPLPSEPFSSER